MIKKGVFDNNTFSFSKESTTTILAGSFKKSGICCSGKLLIKGGVFTAPSYSSNILYLGAVSGNAIISGGSFSSNSKADHSETGMIEIEGNYKLTISGGTFTSKYIACIYAGLGVKQLNIKGGTFTTNSSKYATIEIRDKTCKTTIDKKKAKIINKKNKSNTIHNEGCVA